MKRKGGRSGKKNEEAMRRQLLENHGEKAPKAPVRSQQADPRGQPRAIAPLSSQTGVHEGESRAESDVTLESCVKIKIEDVQVPISPPLNISLAVLGTLAQNLVFLTVVALQLFPHAEGRRRRELCSPIKELSPFDSSKTGGSTKRVTSCGLNYSNKQNANLLRTELLKQTKRKRGRVW